MIKQNQGQNFDRYLDIAQGFLKAYSTTEKRPFSRNLLGRE